MPDLEVLPDPRSLADAGARCLAFAAQEAIASRGRFTVALSGGSTPRGLYARLAQPPYARQVDWRKTHFFWGDERCVPPDHPDSNFRAAQEALLGPAGVPPENVHRILGELDAGRAAARYEDELRQFFGGAEPPRFDLVLLGLGDDGHAASLFPGSPALEEKARWAVAVEHTAPPPPLVPRVTLTFPVLNSARLVVFLVSGQAKAQRLAQALAVTAGPEPFPAMCIQPAAGKVLWLVDRAAAGGA